LVGGVEEGWLKGKVMEVRKSGVYRGSLREDRIEGGGWGVLGSVKRGKGERKWEREKR
jgi:hypothetical protein